MITNGPSGEVNIGGEMQMKGSKSRQIPRAGVLLAESTASQTLRGQWVWPAQVLGQGQIFIVTLFITDKRWKQPKCSSAGKWINKMWSICLLLSLFSR